MSKFTLTNEQVDQYREQGYVVVASFFDQQDLQPVEDAIDELTEQALSSGQVNKIMELEPEPLNGKRVPRRIYNPFHQHEAFQRLATDDRMLDRIECLIGPHIGLHHSKLNMKPPKVGSIVEWHQDLAYFPHTNDDLVTTLVYLDDATEGNGCLQVIPRHHTHYLDHRQPDGLFAGMITEPVDDGRYGNPVPLPGSAGSVIFMHCMTPHSSLPNLSSDPRRTLIFEYRAADAFGIYFGPYVAELESFTCTLRGQPARFARFGGPPPVIPVMPDQFKSLYDLQEQARATAQNHEV